MRIPLAAAAVIIALAAPARADSTVVASIKPLHSLVAGVMKGVDTPELLIPGTTSPHTFSLKPSDARKLEQARVVFWIGPGLETALEHPLETLAADATVETLMNAPGLTQRKFDGDHDHGHDDSEKDDHAEDAHAGHHHGPQDPHIWLDPDNARAMITAIAGTLSDVMPEHARAFEANAAHLTAELDRLKTEVSAILEPVWFKPFLTFHDSLGHFAARFGLAAGEAISLNPEIKPGAKRIAELRREVVEDGFACAFIEPQFDPSIARVIVEGSGVRIATLDPLGSTIDAGPELYSSLIREIATTLRDCMSG
ncbi:MAG: zinc ABC transporter substrate-binding protein [Thalassobaculaceae bacterium]|nr:zinc ABC transporter substrate-binding protein [Thalassobaculaceae bacterium]